MKNLKKYMGLLLALVMCLSLAACGGTPDKLDSIVIDDSVVYDYSSFKGSWLGYEDGSRLIIQPESQEELDEADAERNSRMTFTQYSITSEVIAAGILQYSEKYGYVYAHNDNDGHAYRCWFGEDGMLNISSFGAFNKVSDDVPGEEKDANAELKGTWYLDGDVNASKYIVINDDGTAWEMYEQFDDGSWEKTDNGTLEAKGDDHYDADSEVNPVIYDLHLTGTDTMTWGTLGLVFEDFEKAE